ncbi:hypothetical protein O181_097180 [Austropuccinia psidii MF-1]|uniref:Uncharacterized protein n=1 Tax=Austropuccinia psidii MF-1 TaxID=1389203 RepID=A0A9Q3PDP8_9BASI|nr:hypothetical protein [Austropuccinia psidii MF-1]
MSSKLTSICDSDHSDSLHSVLYGDGVFDNLRELSEESMAPTEIWDINKTYNGFKYVRGPPGGNPVALGKEIALRPKIISQKITEYYGAASRRVEAPVDEPPTSDATSGHSNSQEVPILVNRKDGRLEKLMRNLAVKDENDTDAEGSDEIDGEELEINTPIQKRRIQSTSLSPVQASTTTNEVITPAQPPQPPIRSPIRPSTVASTSTNI